jgi:hypothetical protein
MEPIEIIVKRLDVAIEKLTDVSNEVKQVLVIHETKLTQQEEKNKQQYDQVEKLHKRIGDLRDEVMERLNSLERWRWVLLGGAIVLGMGVGSADIVKIFAG